MATFDLTLTPGTISTTLQSLVPSTIMHFGICKQIFLQADPSNSGVIKVKGANSYPATTATTAYGIQIPIPDSSVPAAPLPFEGNTGLTSLGEIKVRAANTTDIVHVFCITP